MRPAPWRGRSHDARPLLGCLPWKGGRSAGAHTFNSARAFFPKKTTEANDLKVVIAKASLGCLWCWKIGAKLHTTLGEPKSSSWRPWLLGLQKISRARAS